LLERIRVMVARKRGPKKGHGLRPLLAEHATGRVAEHEAEAHDPLVVGA
jgi:hypothetical protein